MSTNFDTITLDCGSVSFCLELLARINRVIRNDAKRFFLSLTGESNPTTTFAAMPNKMSSSKVSLSVRIERTLKRRLVKAARALKMSVSDYVVFQLFQSTKHIELTPNELEAIAKEVRAVEESRIKDQRRLAHRSPLYPNQGSEEKSPKP